MNKTVFPGVGGEEVLKGFIGKMISELGLKVQVYSIGKRQTRKTRHRDTWMQGQQHGVKVLTASSEHSRTVLEGYH